MIKFYREVSMARKIVITSGKGGVGKTTVTANLGIQLAYRGFKVVLVDADVGLNNLDVVMGVENKVSYDLMDVLDGRCKISQALIRDALYQNLYVLPSTRTGGKKKITSAEFKLVVDKLRSADFVLIDCPAGIDVGFHRAVTAATEACVVVTPALSSVRDSDKVLSLLGSYKLESVGLIINRIRPDLVARGDMISAGDIARLLRAPISGIIPEDDKIGLCMSLGYVKDRSSAGRAFSVLAANVVDKGHRAYDYMSDVRVLGMRIKRMFR